MKAASLVSVWLGCSLADPRQQVSGWSLAVLSPGFPEGCLGYGI